MSQAKVLPAQVLMRSAACISCCVFISTRLRRTKNEPSGLRRKAGTAAVAAGGRGTSALLRREVVVPRHLEVDHVVALPLARVQGEGLLRIEHLLEQRVLFRLPGDGLVPGRELGAQ